MGAVQVADVDKVEGVFQERPFQVRVVNLELHVGWHPTGLGWRNIGADDGGGGEGVGDVDDPDAGAGTDVEDALY